VELDSAGYRRPGVTDRRPGVVDRRPGVAEEAESSGRRFDVAKEKNMGTAAREQADQAARQRGEASPASRRV
jgi:hypothetical protein